MHVSYLSFVQNLPYVQYMLGERRRSEREAALYKKIIIGIDQSYENTGIAIAADGVLKKAASIQLAGLKSKTDKRRRVSDAAEKACRMSIPRAEETMVLIERIRLFSRGIVSQPYISTMGALNACIVDACALYGMPVYSIDTRCWKKAVLGSCGVEENQYGVPPEKWPCVRFIIKLGFEQDILCEVSGRKKKGTFIRGGKRYYYNHDAADAAGIALAGFLAGPEKLKAEL